MLDGYKWFVSKDLSMMAVRFYLASREEPQKFLEFTAQEQSLDESAMAAPAVSLPMHEAKQLFQAMWDEGFRPAERDQVKDYSEVRAAMREHIKFSESVANRALDSLIGARGGGD